MMRRDVFQAIADPNRRAIIGLLSKQKGMTLNEVSAQFAISRPAISKHVKILEECGLITIKTQGRERFCEARLKQLKEVSKWADQYQVFWTNKLAALDAFLVKSKPSTTK